MEGKDRMHGQAKIIRFAVKRACLETCTGSRKLACVCHLGCHWFAEGFGCFHLHGLCKLGVRTVAMLSERGVSDMRSLSLRQQNGHIQSFWRGWSAATFMKNISVDARRLCTGRKNNPNETDFPRQAVSRLHVADSAVRKTWCWNGKIWLSLSGEVGQHSVWPKTLPKKVDCQNKRKFRSSGDLLHLTKPHTWSCHTCTLAHFPPEDVKVKGSKFGKTKIKQQFQSVCDTFFAMWEDLMNACSWDDFGLET